MNDILQGFLLGLFANIFIISIFIKFWGEIYNAEDIIN